LEVAVWVTRRVASPAPSRYAVVPVTLTLDVTGEYVNEPPLSDVGGVRENEPPRE